MKPNQKVITALKRCGVSVSIDNDEMTITYMTKHGGEENIEIPLSRLDEITLAEFLYLELDAYDVSYETYIWLDETGHGRRGAPYELADILADKQEWKDKIEELYAVAQEVV